MLGIAFRVSPPTLKLLIHNQKLAFNMPLHGVLLCTEELGLGTRYDEDSGFTAEKIFGVKIIATLNIDTSA